MKKNEDIKILLVEDSPAIASFVQNILEDKKYHVTLAQTGEEALEKTLETTFDIILLDIVMPGINGFTTCERLKSDAKTKNIPVIFLSSLNKPEDKVKAFNSGGVDYIPKPVNPEELLVRMNTHLMINSMHQELQTLNLDLEKKVKQRTSELEETNKKLRIAKEIAEESSKLKSTFLQNITHEIRTPLNGIMGFTQLLLREDLTEDMKQSYIETIYQSSEKLLYIITNIIDLSKVETHQVEIRKEEVLIDDIIYEVFNFYEPLAIKKNIKFELNYTDRKSVV